MSDWLDAERHADQALDLFERGRWAEAESELRKALALNPNQAEWHYNLGLTLEASSRDSEALVCYERSIELMPEQCDPMLAAGMTANRLGHYKQAKGWLSDVLRLEPTQDQAYAGLIESHFRTGHHDEAETTFYLAQQALEEPSAFCFSAIAESLFQRGEYERAGWCLREALRLDPGIGRLRARLAAVLAVTDKPHQALQMFLRELQDDPGSIDTLHDYGDLLMDLGRRPEAAEKYRRILELEPANVAAHFRLGQIAMSGEKYEQAHVEFELVYKLDSTFPRVRYLLADALLMRHRKEQASHYLHEQLDILKADQESRSFQSPHSPMGEEHPGVNQAELASLMLRADMPSEAAKLLELAMETLGEDPDLLRHLALARFNSGDLAGGVIASRRVIRIDSQCIKSMHNLALAALKEDRILTAAGWIRRGMAIDRHDDGLRRLRIRVWLAFGSAFFRRVWRRFRGE